MGDGSACQQQGMARVSVITALRASPGLRRHPPTFFGQMRRAKVSRARASSYRLAWADQSRGRLTGTGEMLGSPRLVVWRPLRFSSTVPSQRGQAVEVLEARGRWRHLRDFKLIDECCRDSTAKPIAHVREFLRRALEHHLHRPVHAVTDPAGDAQRPCAAHASFPITDALYTAIYPHQPTLNHPIFVKRIHAHSSLRMGVSIGTALSGFSQ